MLNLTQTITQFLKLERVDVGGNKGEMLTTSTQEVYRRFMALLGKWQVNPSPGPGPGPGPGPSPSPSPSPSPKPSPSPTPSPNPNP